MESQTESAIRYTEAFVSKGLHRRVEAALRVPDKPPPEEEPSPAMEMWRRTYPLSVTIRRLLGDLQVDDQLFDLDVTIFMPERQFQIFVDAPSGAQMLIDKCSVALNEVIEKVEQWCKRARIDNDVRALSRNIDSECKHCKTELTMISEQCLDDFFRTLELVEKTKSSSKFKVRVGVLGSAATAVGVTLCGAGIVAAIPTAGTSLILTAVGLGIGATVGFINLAGLFKNIIVLCQEAREIDSKLRAVLERVRTRIENEAGTWKQTGRDVLDKVSAGLLDEYFASCETARDLLEKLRVCVANLDSEFVPVYKELLNLYRESLEAQSKFGEAIEGARKVLDPKDARRFEECLTRCDDFTNKFKDATEAAFRQGEEIYIFKKRIEKYEEVIVDIENKMSSAKSTVLGLAAKGAPTAATMTISLITLDWGSLSAQAATELGAAAISAAADATDAKEDMEEFYQYAKCRFGGKEKEGEKK
jgi:hypothetical protein